MTSGPLIDWHTHCWLPEHLGHEWTTQLDGRYGRALSQTATPEHHQEMMRADDVAIAGVVALTIPSIGMHVPNEFVAEYVAAHPGRLFGFASVCPGVGDPVGELRHAVNDLGFRALKLSPPYQGFHPHSPEAWEVYRAAEELGLVVMFHQGAVFTSSGALEYSSPLLLDRVARELPGLRIVIAHMGQPFFAETVAVMSKNPNVYADISARFGRPWQLHQMLLAAVEYRVADRVLFGTDFPVTTPRAAIDVLRTLEARNDDRLPPLDADVRESIVWDRPLALLGLELEQRDPTDADQPGVAP